MCRRRGPLKKTRENRASLYLAPILSISVCWWSWTIRSRIKCKKHTRITGMRDGLAMALSVLGGWLDSTILKVFVKLNDSMVLCSSALWLLGWGIPGVFPHWDEFLIPSRLWCSSGQVLPPMMGFCKAWPHGLSVVRPLTMIPKCRITAPVGSVHCLYRPGLCLNRVGTRYYRSCIKNCLLLSGLNSLLGGQEICWQGNVTFAFFFLLDLAPRGKSRRLWFLQLKISFLSHFPWQIGMSTYLLWNVMVEVLCCQGALKE